MSAFSRARITQCHRIFCLFSGLLGGLALAGWAFGIDLFKAVNGAFVPMNPATATSFAMAAGALWLISDRSRGGKWRYLATLGGLIVLAIGTTRLVAYASPFDLALDQVLFSGRLGSNRVAPNTAIALTLVGTAVLLLAHGSRRAAITSQLLAALVWALSLFSIVGYAYDSSTLYGISSYIPMALNTAVVFQALCGAVLLTRPDIGVMAAVLSDKAGAVMARRLVPAAITIPIVLGWARLAGQAAGWYGTEFGAAIIAVTSIVLFIGIIVWTASSLNALDDERLRSQQELQKLNDGLELRVLERTAELQRANRELGEKNQENETFVYSVSHDLRSPLVNLQGFSNELSLVCNDLREILERSDSSERDRGLRLLDEDMGQSIRFIQTAVKRLSAIIDALLRLSRAGRVQYQLRNVDLNATVQRVVESLHGTIAERNAKVSVNDLPDVWADPTAVEQVFANLIGNALNYLDPARSGMIEVGTCDQKPPDGVHDENSLTYYVRDNGLGIPDAYLGKVFQAFQRLHPDRAPGEGMGLSIIRRAVERHGGQIWFKSRFGEGTTFYVTLPRGNKKKRPNDRDSVDRPLQRKESQHEGSFAYHPPC